MLRTYSVDPRVFDRFPEFRRGVVLATGVNNAETGLEGLLTDAVQRHTQHPAEVIAARLDAWNRAYIRFGADPEKFTPSIRFLHEQIKRGKPVRSINRLVDLFNVISLRWVVPCGGDDLAAIGGAGMRLGFANGTETFSPLFKPTTIDHPDRDEVIYFAPHSAKVMCRRWTWRNADFSKIAAGTTSVAINIDMMMGPFTEHDLLAATRDTTELVTRYCGGSVATYMLSPTQPTFEFAT